MNLPTAVRRTTALLFTQALLVAGGPESDLFDRLVMQKWKNNSSNTFCFLRGQEGTCVMPALLAIVRSVKQGNQNKFLVDYEYIDLEQLKNKIDKYIKKPESFSPKTIECPESIATKLHSIPLSISESEIYHMFDDDGTGVVYFIVNPVSRAYVETSEGVHKQLDYIRLLIECEIERVEKSKWHHQLPPSP